MSRRKKFATLDEGQQQITSFFARVPRPRTASVQATQPAVQQQVTSLTGGALNPGAARVQTAPPPLSPTMPVSRSRDVSSPPSQLSSHQFLPTAHVNDGVLSTMEKKEEEVVCGDQMDVDSCDDSFAKFANLIYTDDFGLSPHQKSAQLSEEEDEDEEEEDLSAVLRRPNSKKVQEFKERYASDTESDEEDDDTYQTEFNRGEMESFLAEQQSSSKCTEFMKPLSDDELSPVLRRPNSGGVQKFKVDYGSDTESDEENDDTYTTEFNSGEMESFLVEQQSSSKCTEFMKPLSGDGFMPMDRRSISKNVQEFKERYERDTDSEEENDDTYPTEFNRSEMESFLAEQQSSSKCTDFMRPLLAPSSKERVLKTEESMSPTTSQSNWKMKQLSKEFCHNDTDSDNNEDHEYYPTVKNNSEMESFLTEQQSSSKCTTFMKPLQNRKHTPTTVDNFQDAVTSTCSLDDHTVSVLKGSQMGFAWILNPFEKSVLSLFNLSTDALNSLNCLLNHAKSDRKTGKNINFSYESYSKCKLSKGKSGKVIFGSAYLAPFVNHLEHNHQITVSMLRKKTEISSGNKMFSLTSEPKKEVIQLFLRERSRLRGDSITPLFEYLTTETSNDEPIVYELLRPFAYYMLKFFSANLKAKTFSCRLKHKKTPRKTLTAQVEKVSEGFTCLAKLQKHLSASHNINIRTIGNIMAVDNSVKQIFEGPLSQETEKLAISECRRLHKEFYANNTQVETERQQLIANSAPLTSSYSTVHYNDPSFVRATILQMFPHCLIDYLNDKNGFIEEAAQLEKEAISIIRNNLQDLELNGRCYAFLLRSMAPDISSLLDVFIYIGQTSAIDSVHRLARHIKSIVTASNQMTTQSQHLYEYIANAINNKQDVFMHDVNKDVAKEESEFDEHCVILFLYSSPLLQNNQVGKPTKFSNFDNINMDDFAKIGCYKIVSLLKNVDLNKALNFKTKLPNDFNKSYMTGKVETAFTLATNQQIPLDLSLVYSSVKTEAIDYAIHLFLSIFTFPPRMAYMYLHSQVNLSSVELKEAVAVVITNHPKSFNECFERARSYFHLVFIQNVQEANRTLEEMGVSYRRYPSSEDTDNAKSFIKATAVLLARLYKIDMPSEEQIIAMMHKTNHPITAFFPSRVAVSRITKFADLNQLLSFTHNTNLPSPEELKSTGFDVIPINMFVDDKDVVQFLHTARLLRQRNFIKSSPGYASQRYQKHPLYFLNSHNFPLFYK